MKQREEITIEYIHNRSPIPKAAEKQINAILSKSTAALRAYFTFTAS